MGKGLFQPGQTEFVDQAVVAFDRADMEDHRHVAEFGVMEEIPHAGIVKPEVGQNLADPLGAHGFIVVEEPGKVGGGGIVTLTGINAAEPGEIVGVLFHNVADFAVGVDLERLLGLEDGGDDTLFDADLIVHRNELFGQEIIVSRTFEKVQNAILSLRKTKNRNLFQKIYIKNAKTI